MKKCVLSFLFLIISFYSYAEQTNATPNWLIVYKNHLPNNSDMSIIYIDLNSIEVQKDTAVRQFNLLTPLNDKSVPYKSFITTNIINCTQRTLGVSRVRLYFSPDGTGEPDNQYLTADGKQAQKESDEKIEFTKMQDITYHNALLKSVCR